MMAVDTYFEDIEFQITNHLNSARESVKICVAWINGRTYAPILQQLSQRGVKVEVIYNNDHTNANYGMPVSPLYSLYPIETRLSSSFMHNKFCIIDDEVVITGSFNWSQKAKDSFENIVVIKHEYKLVKSLLHEFYDLKHYYQAFSSNFFEKCQCRSHAYNLAILGYEAGKYDESKIEIWKLCVKNQHVSYLGEEYEQYLQTQLGMKDAPCWNDGYYDKSSMIGEFQQERSQIQSLQSYFNNRSRNRIHAVGVVSMSNGNGHIEYGEDPDYVVNIIWRDMYYRKIIPDVLYDDGSDGINSIISEHA
jgi:hypothetical protein